MVIQNKLQWKTKIIREKKCPKLKHPLVQTLSANTRELQNWYNTADLTNKQLTILYDSEHIFMLSTFQIAQPRPNTWVTLATYTYYVFSTVK